MSDEQQADPAETPTDLAERARANMSTILEKLDEARAHAPDLRPLYYPTLPTTADPLSLTLTLDELHDIVRNAASLYLHTLSGLRHDKALKHADRIAQGALDLARAQLEHEADVIVDLAERAMRP